MRGVDICIGMCLKFGVGDVRMSADAHSDMDAGMCADIGIDHRYEYACRHVHEGVFIDTCLDMRVDMRTDMGVDMCIDMSNHTLGRLINK